MISTENKLDSLGRSYATGRRKNSVARVWVKNGKGLFIVNGKQVSDYFEERSKVAASKPFSVLEMEGKFDVMCTVKGGGFTGQSEAIRHGVAKALLNHDPSFRGALKSFGLITTDTRRTEEKKYGLVKARKRKPFRKR